MSADRVVNIANLTLSLPTGADRAEAVSHLSLQLERGRVTCIVGESGSGKSMLAHAIMGLLPSGVAATSGRIDFEGCDLLHLKPEEMQSLRGRRLGMIFQEPMAALNPLMRVGDQIAEVFEAHKALGASQRKARALELLADVGLPEPERMLSAYPFQLSGGQRQRIMIAMALALEPSVLIADEPTTALDVTTQAQILSLIKALQARHGTAVLFITHDFGVVAEIADDVAVMQDGKIVEAGPAATILNTPQHPYTRQLIAAVPSLVPPEPRTLDDRPPVLATKGLSKVFLSRGRWFTQGRRVVAAEQVSFAIRRGETLGLVGGSGSGKSTVGRCIAGLIEPQSGAVWLDQIDLTSASSAERFRHRRRIQMVFQDPYSSLNPRHKVGATIAAGPIAHGVDKAQAYQRARDLLDLVGLSSSAADRFPHEFSGGQRQRIGIARALALEPDVLVADEPVSALDVSVQAKVLELISDLQRRLNLTLLFITHDLRVAAQVCDRIAVMQNGQIVEIATAAEIYATPRHAYTQSLLGSIPGAEWAASRR
jgi:peptide/nickel transport system ATP-binding protein